MVQFDRQSRQLLLGPGAELRLDGIAGKQDGAELARSPAPDVACKQAMIGRQKTRDRPMFAVGPQRAHQGRSDQRCHIPSYRPAAPRAIHLLFGSTVPESRRNRRPGQGRLLI